MSLGMKLEGTEKWTPRIHRMQAGFVPKMMIEEELITSILDQGVVIARRILQQRIGHKTNMGTTRFPDKPNTGTLWNAIHKTGQRLGVGRVVVDKTLFSSYFYALTFEYGMAKHPNYYARHFWKDAVFLMDRAFRKEGRMVLRRVRNHYGGK